MSRARHSKHEGKAHAKHRASGGGLPEIASGDPQVLEEARSTKSIGKIEGERAKSRGDRKRASGGGVWSSAHTGPKIEGSVEKHGSKPVSKEEHGSAVKAALKRGGRC